MTPDDRIDILQEFLAEELARIQGQLGSINGAFNQFLFERMKIHYREAMQHAEDRNA